MRELEERLGFGALIAQRLTDSRRGKNTKFPFADLLLQSVYSRLAGYEDLDHAERLSHEPAFQLIGSEKIWDQGATLTSRLQSVEKEILAEAVNFLGLPGSTGRSWEERNRWIPVRERSRTCIRGRSPSTASKSTARTTGVTSRPAITPAALQ